MYFVIYIVCRYSVPAVLKRSAWDTVVAGIFVWVPPGRRHLALHQSCTRLKLPRAVEDLVSTVVGGAPFGGPFFVNVVSLNYIGTVRYINVSEMCFIPMNARNELFNGVRQLKWQHLPLVVSTFSASTDIRLLSSFFIKHCILPLSFCGATSRFSN